MINLDVADSHENALAAAPQALKLCQMIEASEDWECECDEIMDKFQAEEGRRPLYSVLFYDPWSIDVPLSRTRRKSPPNVSTSFVSSRFSPRPVLIPRVAAISDRARLSSVNRARTLRAAASTPGPPRQPAKVGSSEIPPSEAKIPRRNLDRAKHLA